MHATLCAVCRWIGYERLTGWCYERLTAWCIVQDSTGGSMIPEFYTGAVMIPELPFHAVLSSSSKEKVNLEFEEMLVSISFYLEATTRLGNHRPHLLWPSWCGLVLWFVSVSAACVDLGFGV